MDELRENGQVNLPISRGKKNLLFLNLYMVLHTIIFLVSQTFEATSRRKEMISFQRKMFLIFHWLR
jgi:hypothetical protein